jgi:hypothetical protein
VKVNDKTSQGSSFSGFGASFFPVISRVKIGPDLLAEEETLPLLDHHLPCPEAKRQLLKERTQQYPEHVERSIFETSCGLVQDKLNTFGSFPEYNHASSAIQFVNDCLSVKVNDKSSHGSSFSGFRKNSAVPRTCEALQSKFSELAHKD